jgi:hypothetical protein
MFLQLTLIDCNCFWRGDMSLCKISPNGTANSKKMHNTIAVSPFVIVMDASTLGETIVF